MSVTIKLKRGNKDDLPKLEEGEPGICLDSGELYVGTQAGNKKIVGDTTIADTVTGGKYRFEIENGRLYIIEI